MLGKKMGGCGFLYEGIGARDGRCWGRKWEDAKHFYEGNGTEDGRMRIGCPIATERRMGDNGSFVR